MSLCESCLHSCTFEKRMAVEEYCSKYEQNTDYFHFYNEVVDDSGIKGAICGMSEDKSIIHVQTYNGATIRRYATQLGKTGKVLSKKEMRVLLKQSI